MHPTTNPMTQLPCAVQTHPQTEFSRLDLITDLASSPDLHVSLDSTRIPSPLRNLCRHSWSEQISLFCALSFLYFYLKFATVCLLGCEQPTYVLEQTMNLDCMGSVLDLSFGLSPPLIPQPPHSLFHTTHPHLRVFFIITC